MTRGLRLLLADDHELIRKGIRAVIEAQPGWTVCGEAGNGREAVEEAHRLKPDIVVMDLTMPDLNGLDATRRIRKELPQTEVLILTIHDSEQLLLAVLKAGAKAYLLKSDIANTLLAAIESLSQSKPFFSSAMSEIMLETYLSPEPQLGGEQASGLLTAREREMVQLIAEGRSTKDCAAVLGISVKTAETHRANLMRKLDIHSVSEVVRYAIRNHIVGA